MVDRFWDTKNQWTEGFLKEYAHWIVEVSYRQHTLGCFIIFAKEKVQLISELSSQAVAELPQVMADIEGALRRNKTFRPDHFNYWQMGNKLKHLHFHGIPRYSSAREYDGRAWKDEAWGHPPIWTREEQSGRFVNALRNEIRPHLS